MAAPASMTSSQPARPAFDWRNLGLRVASAAILAPAAIYAVWAGGTPFFILVCVASALLAVEWGGMSTPATPIRRVTERSSSVATAAPTARAATP